jgi:hypothetical protein
LSRVSRFCHPPILDNALFFHRAHDNRPYIHIEILGERILALLDSGANQSIIGKDGLFLIKKLNLSVLPLRSQVKLLTADGTHQSLLGQVVLPMCVEGVCKELRVLVSDSVNVNLTVGIDFCYLFGIGADFKKDSFYLPEISTLTSVDETNGLTDEQQRKLNKIIELFKEIGGKKLGKTKLVEHHIDTGSATPIKQRYYQLSPAMLKILDKEVDEMLSLGVIRESFSPWSSACVLVKKKNGEYRFCFDGRSLNKVTKRDAYPLPYVNDILDRLRDVKFLSSIDLSKAFWQIPLSADSCEKTAFTVPRRGLFEFTVLPFGLHNSPQTLQRLMDRLFGPKFDNVFVYLDDIIIASRSFQEHVDTLFEVYKQLKEAGLSVNLEKCDFCKFSLNYLGFTVDRKGLRTNDDKIKALVEYPTPRTTTEIKRFLGMAGWYRRFIPDFSTLVSPILELNKGRAKRQPIKWTLGAENSFLKLKQLLVSAPILTNPDFSKPFIIQTDASDTGLAAVLIQGEGEDERVIAYASRSLNKSERNYSATEKECLAVLFGIEKYRPYVEGTHFQVITDHYSLLWLAHLQNPSGRLARWSLRMAQYNFSISHRKGKLNVVPDALSRAFFKVNSLEFNPVDLEPWYTKMLARINEQPERHPSWKVEGDRIYKYVPNKHNIVSNLIEWKLVVPRQLRPEVLRKCHDEPMSAHLGFFKTLSKICEKYYWPKMRTDVLRYVRRCETCLGSKASNKARPGLMGKDKLIKYPFQLLSVDIMGPFPRSSKGNSYLLAVADWFTKFVLLKPLKKATGPAIVKYLEDEVFLMFGVPQIVMCDNGSQFVGATFKKLMNTYKIQRVWYNARYTPQVNPVERVNRVIGTAIRSYVKDNHRSWDQEVYKIGHAIRNAVHEVTGFTPSFLNFGRTIPPSGDFYGKLENVNPEDTSVDTREKLAGDLHRLSDIHKDMVNRLRDAYEKNKRHYDLRKRTLRFKVGDIVWKRNFVLSNAAANFAQKLAPKYVRCTIREVTGPLTYRLRSDDGKNLGIWHVKDLKENP